MTPRCEGWAVCSPLYLPTVAGTSQVLRVRSGDDLRPGLAAVARLPERVGREEERPRVDRREQDGLGADRSPVGRAGNAGADRLDLAGATVPARDAPAAVDDVGVERVGRGVAVFVDADGPPLAEGDPAVVAPARDAGRAALLLAAVEAIGEGVVGRDMVELGGRLVVPRAPGLAAVDGDHRALVAGVEDDGGVSRVDPEVLVIVAARGALESPEGLPAVCRFPGDGRSDEDRVGIGRVDGQARQVAAADAGGGACVGKARPGGPGVVGTVEGRAAGEGDRGVDAAGIGRGKAKVDLNDRLGLRRRRGGVGGEEMELAPGRAAVGRFVEAAVRTAPGGVLPRALAGFPETGVDDGRVLGIEGELGAARVLVDVEDALERPAAVEGAVDAAFLVRAVGMAEDGGEEAVGAARIDDDLRDLLAVPEAEVGPGPAGVGRFVDAVADREVGPLEALTARDVDDVRVRGRDGDGPDRARRLVVEDGAPGAAVVGRLPDAAVANAHVEDVGLRWDAGYGPGAPGAVGPDRAPAHLGEELLVKRLGGERGRSEDGGREQEEGRRCQETDDETGYGGSVLQEVRKTAGCPRWSCVHVILSFGPRPSAPEIGK